MKVPGDHVNQATSSAPFTIEVTPAPAGTALRVRPYEYAHPEDFSERISPAPPLIVALDGVTPGELKALGSGQERPNRKPSRRID